MVDDLDNGGDLPGIWPCAHQSDAADLNVAPLRCCHVCVAHLVCGLLTALKLVTRCAGSIVGAVYQECEVVWAR